MASSPEARLSARIEGAIQAHWPRAFLFKVHGNAYQQGGLPDIMGSIEGRAFGLEVKLPGMPHPLSKRQEITLLLMSRSGAITGVPTSVEEAIEILEDGLEAPNPGADAPSRA